MAVHAGLEQALMDGMVVLHLGSVFIYMYACFACCLQHVFPVLAKARRAQ